MSPSLGVTEWFGLKRRWLLWRKRRSTDDILALDILYSLATSPEKWVFRGPYVASKGSVHVWRANRRYADMALCDVGGQIERRFPFRWRGQLRHAFDAAHATQRARSITGDTAKVVGNAVSDARPDGGR